MVDNLVKVIEKGIDAGHLRMEVSPNVFWSESQGKYIEGCLGRIGPGTKFDESGRAILPPWEYHKLSCGAICFQLTKEIKDSARNSNHPAIFFCA